MVECTVCGKRFDALVTLECPSCGTAQQPLSAFPFRGGEPGAGSGGVLPGSTHDYEIVQRYELVPGRRPISAVLHGGDLLVLALSQGDTVIHRFDLDGRSLGVLGPYRSGDGPDEIGEPAGIALDDAGTIFVLDSDHCRVLKIDRSGAVIGALDGDLSYPRDMELTDDGILLADTRNNRIQKWDHAGQPVLTIPPVDEDEGARAPAGRRPGELDGPMGVTADHAGHIYVADTNNHRVQIFDPMGKFVRELGAEGGGSGHLLFPTDVRVPHDTGEIFVFDLHSRRVQKFDRMGRLLYGVVLRNDGPDALVGAIGDIDIGHDETIYIPVPAEGVVLRCRRVGA